MTKKQLSKKKILHLLDGSDFVGIIVDTFCFYGVDSDFLICIEPHEDRQVYEERFPQVDIVVVGSSEYRRYLESDEYDVLWLHGFEWWKARFVVDFKLPCKVIWSAFGGGRDYLMLLPEERIYGPVTSALIHARNIECGLISRFYRKCRRIMAYSWRWRYYKVHQFLGMVDAFSLVMPTEEPILRKLIPRARLFEFLYTRERVSSEILALPEFKESSRRRVWVGNSATLMNNHLDAITALAQIKNQFDEIVVPYSYGHQSTIVKADIEAEAAKYGLNLVFLENKMPYAEYCECMKGCGALVFAQYQQGGCGNVSMAFMLGLKVFLSKRSPLYKYYKGMGYKVFTIEHDLPHKDSLMPLSDDNRHWNWECVKKRAVWSVFTEKTMPFLECLRRGT